jgi:DeoR/GlpR family transcriptional regulator of sugar metabolism
MKDYFSEERKIKILELIEEKEKVTVAELAKKFKASEATIRRDLNVLCKNKMIVRAHGGALRKADFKIETPFDERRLLYLNEKKAIAAASVKLINDGDTILLGGGSTIFQLAKLLDSFKDLRVVTNAIDIAMELSKFENIDITFVGGNIRKNNLVTVGQAPIKFLNDLYIEKLFISVTGVDLDKGVTSTSPIDAEVIIKMLEVSRDKFLLADSSKFGKVCFKKISPISCFDEIITDSKIDIKIAEEIQNSGTKITIV